MSDMTQYLEQIAGLMEMNRKKPDGWKYGSYERMILNEGTHWTDGRLETNGELKECYQNSFLLAVRKGYRYVEGYAMSQMLLPIMHAWCLDDDVVVETTWEDVGVEYMGIELDTHDALMVMSVTGVYGVLGSEWEVGYPLLRLGDLDREELESLAEAMGEEE